MPKKEVYTFDFLSNEESSCVIETITNLRKSWRVRNKHEDFYVLGTTCYAEAQADLRLYNTLAHFYNKLLEENFSELYRKLESFLQNLTGLKVYYREDLCRPGFHILGKPALTGVPHVDAQYRFIPEYAHLSKLKEDEILTFTAIIQVLNDETGMYIWPDFEFDGYEKQNAKDFLEYSKQVKPEVFSYQNNKIYIHTGHLLHQILPTPQDANGKLRITLQGFSIKTEKGLLIYF
jgi:hypothetical protein